MEIGHTGSAEGDDSPDGTRSANEYAEDGNNLTPFLGLSYAVKSTHSQ